MDVKIRKRKKLLLKNNSFFKVLYLINNHYIFPTFAKIHFLKLTSLQEYVCVNNVFVYICTEFLAKFVH